MFESILANFLTSRVAQFVKHIPQEQLRVGVWRGEIVLDDLELRADCLDGLGLPLSLEAGYVGSLRISIPWSSLGSKPVVAEFERIHLILRLQVCYSAARCPPLLRPPIDNRFGGLAVPGTVMKYCRLIRVKPHPRVFRKIRMQHRRMQQLVPQKCRSRPPSWQLSWQSARMARRARRRAG